MDIGEKTPAADEVDGEGEEEAAEGMQEVQTDHPEEESAQEPKDEEEEQVGDGKDNDPAEDNDEEALEDEEGKSTANGDLRVPVDEGQKPKVRNSQREHRGVHVRGACCVT